MEKALKLRRCEVETMDQIAKGLEDAARRDNSKIFYWYVNELRGSSQCGLVLVKHRNITQLVMRKKSKRNG